jgi:glycosyltransferase involved in cell wall biosynthesis
MPLPTDGVFARVERVFLPKWRSRLNALCAVPTRTPLQVAYYRSAQFAQKVHELLGSHDVCLAHLIRSGDYVRSAPVPTMLEMTDAISLNYQRVKSLRKARGLRSMIYKLEAARLLDYERRILDEFSGVSLVSETDRAFLLEGNVPDSRTFVCSNGVDLEKFSFQPRFESEPVAVFIGNMTSVQNMDAAVYFAEEILPLARAKLPIRFRVIGRMNPSEIRRLERYEGVEIMANVADINSAVKDARVGVAPIRLGAGVQNKVLEYMAVGLPVVTSSIGLEGLAAKPEADVIVADSPSEYVAALSALWIKSELRDQLARSGYEYVRTHHSWSAQLDGMVKRISMLIDKSSNEKHAA